MPQDFMDAMQFRFACKEFDSSKKIPEDDLRYILEAGRLSPSSFGMEQWRFLVIQNEELKATLRPACWDQKQITTCSDLVVIYGLKNCLRPDQLYPREMLGRRVKDEDKLDKYMERYSGFMQDKLDDQALACWSTKQCYIASGNMMTAAAVLGIDSCAIEGFEKEKVDEILKVEHEKEEIAMLIAFGHRIKDPHPKIRLSLDEVVTYKK